MHGRIFKKLREERGYKLKDVAGDVISTRTLTRFENDETSLPIATFEELLENLGVSYLDYLVCYYKHTEMKPSISLKSNQPYMQLDSISKLMNEYKKELKNNDINFEKRLEVLTYINSIVSREDLELFEENKRMIKKKCCFDKIKKKQRDSFKKESTFVFLCVNIVIVFTYASERANPFFILQLAV